MADGTIGLWTVPLAVFGGSSEDVADQLRSTLSEETKLMSTFEPTVNPMEKSASLTAAVGL